MTSIKIIANGASVSAIVDGELTSGMVGIPVKIEYDNAWNSLIKTASFRVGSFARSRKNIGTSTTVPWEVMRHSGKPLQVGVEGRDKDGNLVMPTIWVSVGTIKDGATSGIPGAPNPEQEVPSGGDGAIIDDNTISFDSAWSSKNTVDKLCPSFEETGKAVACESLEGYPLEVISEIPYTSDNYLNAVTITHCGKNLFDFKQSVAELNIASSAGGITTRFGHAIRLPAGTYTIHVENAQAANRYIYGTVNTKDGSFKATCNLVILESIHKRTVTIDEGDVIYIYNGVVGSSSTGTEFVFEQFDIQIEKGSVATAYEPYFGQTYTVDFSEYEPLDIEGTYNWTTGVLVDDINDDEMHLNPQPMPAYSGINTFISKCDIGGNIVISNTTVKGKKDPVKVIERLEATVNALLGG